MARIAVDPELGGALGLRARRFVLAVRVLDVAAWFHASVYHHAGLVFFTPAKNRPRMECLIQETSSM